MGDHLHERGAGVGGEMLAVCLERVPRQLQAHLPGDSIGRGLQKVGPGAEQLKPGEEVLTAYPRKWCDFAEALVGDEATGVSAGVRRAPECCQLSCVSRLASRSAAAWSLLFSRSSNYCIQRARSPVDCPAGGLGDVRYRDRLWLERLSSSSRGARRCSAVVRRPRTAACSAATRRAVASAIATRSCKAANWP